MHLNKTKLLIPAIVASIGLLGCGEGTNTTSAQGGNGGANAETPPKAGETYTTAILADGKPLVESTYLIYSVSNQGQLSSTPLPDVAQEAQLPHVLVKQSEKVSATITPSGSIQNLAVPKLSPPIPLGKIESCYSDIWKNIQAVQPNATPQQLAGRITQFGVSIDNLCTYIASSGMPVQEYVQLFQTVQKYFPNNQSNIDRQIIEFFSEVNTTPKNFKAALTQKGYTWDDFLKKVSADKNGVYDFVNGYANSKQALESYISEYMTRPSKVAGFANDRLKLVAAYLTKGVTPGFLARLSPPHLVAQTTLPTADTINGYTDAVKKVLVLGKSVWDFIRSGQAVIDEKTNNVNSSVLSAADNNPMNYVGSKHSTSPKLEFVGKRLWWENYRVDFTVDAYYDGKNATVPGQWLPLVIVNVSRIKADYGYKIDGSAKITSVINTGAAENPVPEIQVILTYTATNWSVNQMTYKFIANGATGVRHAP